MTDRSPRQQRLLSDPFYPRFFCGRCNRTVESVVSEHTFDRNLGVRTITLACPYCRQTHTDRVPIPPDSPSERYAGSQGPSRGRLTPRGTLAFPNRPDPTKSRS